MYPFPLKAPYCSKIDILIQERFDKLIYSINMITKMWHLTACKNSVSLSFWSGSKMKWVLWINVGNISSEIGLKKIISFQERETNWNFTDYQVPRFMIVSIPYIKWHIRGTSYMPLAYINLLNLSWLIKCLFLRNMNPCHAASIKLARPFLIFSQTDYLIQVIHSYSNS